MVPLSMVARWLDSIADVAGVPWGGQSISDPTDRYQRGRLENG
jgi:hypothetical protein